MKLNTQALLEMAALAEERGVAMRHWLKNDVTESECGTVGCLVGTYAYFKDRSLLESYSSGVLEGRRYYIEIPRALRALGITSGEFNWLFILCRNSNYSSYTGLFSVQPNLHERSLCSTTTKQAVRRLRKFIYFKLKQAEIHEAWNERHHRRGMEAENTRFVAEGYCEQKLQEAAK